MGHPRYHRSAISIPRVQSFARPGHPAQAIKFGPGDEGTFWQTRYYDHNVRTYESFVEKLRYIHRNPVKRGLVERPEDWTWSSFRHYATREAGPVEIESQWTADRRNGKTATLLSPAAE
jgi:putative transposase